MIPQLPRDSGCSLIVTKLFGALRQSSYSGELSTSEVAKVLASNDNSIWQQKPSAVIAPRTASDISLLLSLLATPEFQSIKITPRGGGTSTAGQSITDSISLDCKRFLNKITCIDVENKQVTVECGAVLSTVNSELAKHNLMIGPTVATADRATIGGMIANDSAGKGSLVYGKMSDCVVSLTTVLRSGTIWESRSMRKDELNHIEKIRGVVDDIHSEVRRACEAARPFLKENWPDLPRFVSGYNLPMGWDGEVFNLNRILCGSEGTLGVIAQATLQCVDIPRNQQLIVVGLKSFDGALRCGASIAHLKPSAVEAVDELVLAAAKESISFPMVESAASVLFIECKNGNEILQTISSNNEVISTSLLKTNEEIEKAWHFRNRSVGLLSSIGLKKRPVPFVEDCAVPPDRLADFISELQKLLDKRDLRVGMFGHVDAGVIHVRPALDLCSESDRSLIRIVMDEVAILVQSYGGVLWGEHGKGFRSEYGPKVFGDGLWEQICRVKAVFDPTNQFNPGKVAAPTENHPLASIDSPTRGEVNTLASPLPILTNSHRCDGNSQCRSEKLDESMCPTFRLAYNPLHSPRGRAEMLRHWLTRIGGRNISTNTSFIGRMLNRFMKDDFSHDVRDSLSDCIGCRACSSDCAMIIDIPKMRSVFLDYYYSRFPRPFRDFIWFRMEWLLAFRATLVGRICTPSWLAPLFGIVDPPKVSKRLQIKTSSISKILTTHPKVIILQDSFTTCVRPELVVSLLSIVKKLGIDAAVLPLKPCGKALHVRGKRKAFHAVAQANVQWLKQLGDANVPIVGIDPAAALLWREEYPEVLGSDDESIGVLLPQKWLVEQDLSPLHVNGSWRLFPHCIERVVETELEEKWQEIFERVGAHLEVVRTACCGMGGLFGHEREHKQQSIDIWHQSWGRHKPETSNSLATGYSCCSQARRVENITLRHPLEVLAK
ncbi:FAD-binding oxidoreductase [PVC group bacterium]|nr:FAD-binding oxidoreductase [PVC group bacterium]